MGFIFHALPEGGHCALVCRSQGDIGELDRIKQFRKAHFQLVPLFLLMDSLIVLTNLLGLDEIRVISPDENYQTRLGHERLHALYRQAFEPFQAHPTADGRLAIRLPLEEKPLESIDRHHRKRTQLKREARERMRNAVQQSLDDLGAYPQERPAVLAA